MKENEVLGIVFSNIHDQTLGVLTEKRTTASVPFAGRYRFIDFVLSNLTNSGVREVGIITKNNYQSLADHVGKGKEWDLDRKRGGLSILSPYSHANTGIYRGRMEALAGAMSYIRHSQAKYVILSDSDLIASMDFRPYLQRHVDSGAEMTLLYKPMAPGQHCCKGETLLRVEEDGRVTDAFLAEGDAPADGQEYLDIAILDRQLLERKVAEAVRRGGYHFLQDFLWPNLGSMDIRGAAFEGFATRVQTLEGYYAASMRLLDPNVRRALFRSGWPIYTKVRDQVPVKYGLNAKVSNCLVADGAVIEGTVEDSILFRGVKVGKGAVVRNCILLQGTVVGENANLGYVIADKDVRIQDGRVLTGFTTYPVYIPKGNLV